jgi:hypothetical protein
MLADRLYSETSVQLKNPESEYPEFEYPKFRYQVFKFNEGLHCASVQFLQATQRIGAVARVPRS